MKFSWNELKDERLKRVRGVSFEEILKAEAVDIRLNPNRGDQLFMLFWHKNYIWVVPYVENETGAFLKTLYPSRKYTKIYKGKFAR